MQYDQVFFNQRFSDGTARKVRLTCDGNVLSFSSLLVQPDIADPLATDLYLDEQDREALAEALVPKPFVPGLHWSELFAMGLVVGILFGFVCGAAL